MALISNIGRAGLVTYGTQAVFSFSIRFMTFDDTSNIPFTTYGPMTPTNLPTPGTLTIAGTTVTLTAADVINPMAVAQKIKGTAITGYTVSIDTYNLNIVTLQSTSIGPVTKPSVALGTATDIIFYDLEFTQGVNCPTGALDDILVQGRTPITLTLATTSVTAAVSTSTGTAEEQELGTLTYGTALTFSGGTITITAPVNYIRITTSGVSAASQAKLYITR